MIALGHASLLLPDALDAARRRAMLTEVPGDHPLIGSTAADGWLQAPTIKEIRRHRVVLWQTAVNTTSITSTRMI